MFKLFKTRPAQVAPAPAKPAATHIVRDRYTRRELMRGTQAACMEYLAAFGLCYIETL